MIDGDGTDLFLSILFLDFLKFSLLLGDDFLDLSLEESGEGSVLVRSNASVLRGKLMGELKRR